jgi:hypothetical protein
MRELDLSSLELYNRHDLVELFLLSVIFTEFSDIRKLGTIKKKFYILVIQNLDVGRGRAYIYALNKFEDHIKKMKAKKET